MKRPASRTWYIVVAAAIFFAADNVHYLTRALSRAGLMRSDFLRRYRIARSTRPSRLPTGSANTVAVAEQPVV